MTKDGEMAHRDRSEWRDRMTSATRSWSFVPLCVAALACGSAVAGAAVPDDAGRSGFDDAPGMRDKDHFNPLNALPDGRASDVGGGSSGTSGQGGSSGGDDSPPPAKVCLPEGRPCTDGGVQCCNNDCKAGACGTCLGEGETCVTGGMTKCCDSLACTASGHCGTAACVWEGEACGGDSGVVCCNDDCNAVSGMCGP